jgi:hypothetical protein
MKQFIGEEEMAEVLELCVLFRLGNCPIPTLAFSCGIVYISV